MNKTMINRAMSYLVSPTWLPKEYEYSTDFIDGFSSGVLCIFGYNRYDFKDFWPHVAKGKDISLVDQSTVISVISFILNGPFTEEFRDGFIQGLGTILGFGALLPAYRKRVFLDNVESDCLFVDIAGVTHGVVPFEELKRITEEKAA